MRDLSRLPPKIPSDERPAPGEFIIVLSILLYIPFFLHPFPYITGEKKEGEEGGIRKTGVCVVNLCGEKFRDEKRFRVISFFESFFFVLKINFKRRSPFEFERVGGHGDVYTRLVYCSRCCTQYIRYNTQWDQIWLGGLRDRKIVKYISDKYIQEEVIVEHNEIRNNCNVWWRDIYKISLISR